LYSIEKLNEYKYPCLGYGDMTVTSYLKGIISVKTIPCYIYAAREDKEYEMFNNRADNCLFKIT
jgi:hypothetical protein